MAKVAKKGKFIYPTENEAPEPDAWHQRL